MFIICLLKCYSAKLMNEEEKPNNHRQQQEKIYLKKYMMEKLFQITRQTALLLAKLKKRNTHTDRVKLKRLRLKPKVNISIL